MYKSKLKRKQVLLIDDEQNLSQTLSMLLETRGYDVQIANCGERALQIVSPNFDLIILDLVLPDLNGFEVCRRIKQGEFTQHIPIIILSASEFSKDKIEGLYLGADDYLSKPCEHEELFARMEAVMRRRDVENTTLENRQQLEIICELRKILEQALIVPHFQPIYKFEPFKLYGLELLTRPTSEGILANPDIFFNAALKYGMYPDMEILSWTMAVNLVSEHIKDEKIFLNCNPYLIESISSASIEDIFNKGKVKPKNVIMEITERSNISDFKLFNERLRRYRDIGFRFAVDDVGGGYASLESIVETKPEVVKIDRHIINGISKDTFKQSIVKFVVGLCKENGIMSVAEGIEKFRDLEFVRSIGVDAGQGYYLYKPTPIVDFADFYTVNF